MTEQQPTGTDGLQFDKAEFSAAAPASNVCAACNAAITQEYFQTNGKVICPSCRQGIAAQMTGGSATTRYFTALALGIGAGIVGWGIYYAVYLMTDSQWGLISILVGYLVGMAISKGSRGRGGWAYQSMAVVITYLSIVSSYIPIFHEIEPTVPYAVLFISSIAVPFLGGMDNIIGVLIIAFGLYQAWRMNKRLKLDITGPFTITPNATPPALT